MVVGRGRYSEKTAIKRRKDEKNMYKKKKKKRNNNQEHWSAILSDFGSTTFFQFALRPSVFNEIPVCTCGRGEPYSYPEDAGDCPEKRLERTTMRNKQTGQP